MLLFFINFSFFSYSSYSNVFVNPRPQKSAFKLFYGVVNQHNLYINKEIHQPKHTIKHSYSCLRLAAGLATAALMVCRAMLRTATARMMEIEKANNPAFKPMR